MEGAGWLRARVESVDQSWTALASHLSDAPEDFLDAVLAMFYGASRSDAVWWEEPQAARPYEYIHWIFRRHDDEVQVQVVGNNEQEWDATSGDTVFNATTGLSEFGRAVVAGVSAALSGLSDEDYREQWSPRSDRGELMRRLADIERAFDGVISPLAGQRLHQNREQGFGAYRATWS
jgi:hypothetical protein